MTHFRSNHSGFTLAEMLIAVLIVAVALTPIFARQSGLLGRVAQSSHLLDYWLKARQFLTEALEKAENKQLEKKVGQPPLYLVYTSSKVSEQSSLKKIKNLQRKRVDYRDKPDGKSQGSIVTFMVEPEKKAS